MATNVLKIDSNQTELRIAKEDTIGVLPATPVWVQYDPNSYDDFGGEITTVARNPINSSRQRKKGVVTDLEASGGFEIDVTQDNLQELMQGFLFAAARTKVELSVSSVDGTGNDYQPTSGGAGYFAGNLLFAKGYLNAANNGLKVVTGTPTGTSVAVTDTALVDEEGATNGVISRVGHVFGTGVASIDASGALPKLNISGVVAASSVFTTTGTFSNGETVTIDGKVYTLQTTLTDVDGNVKIGASTELTLVNLRNAINRNGLGVPGVDYATSTTANPDVTAVNDATTLTATAIIAGVTGNAITTAEVCANASWTGATLASGAGHSFLEFGLVAGEFVCLGDDGTNQSFATAANNGLKRVREIANSSLTFDKSTLAMVTDAGTGKDIRVVMSRIVKNETGSLVVRRSYQLERSLGAPDTTQPTQIQSEYLTGSIPNEFELSVQQAEKVVATVSFMSRDHETRTGVQGFKSGTRPVLVDADAFNSTSHVARISLAEVDPANEAPTDLFAFVMDMTLSINNNVSANKAIGFLGAFDNTAGTFEVSAELNAYFADVAAIQTVRDNADVTLDITFAQANKGITIDLPLVSLGNALADVQQDEAIMIPITADAATAAKLDPDLNHTMMIQFWDYLPTLAA